MKKVLAVVLALVVAISLIACGESSGGEIKKPANVTTDDTKIPQQSEQEEKPKVEATISETVLMDEAGVKITAKSLEMDDFWGPAIKLLIENNSGKDLTVQCRNVSVNGYMVKTMMSADVVNGKKANDSLTIMESSLKESGIDAIADLELSFHIFNTADWETYLDTDMIQLKTSIADGFEYVYDDSGDLAYEGNGIKIVVKGLVEDASIVGPGILVYIENNSAQDFTVQTRDVSINGFMMDALFSSDVMAGKRIVDTITFMESKLEENSITAIESVEMFFHIFDLESWDTIIDTEVVKITF